MKINIEKITTVTTLLISLSVIVYQAGIVKSDVTNLSKNDDLMLSSIKSLEEKTHALIINNESTQRNITTSSEDIIYIRSRLNDIEEKVEKSSIELRNILIESLRS